MKKLFTITLSLTIVSAIVMAVVGKGFHFKDGHAFSIMNLEMPGSEAALTEAYNNMDDGVLESVRAHLHADYFFMLGCYPFVALICLTVARTAAGTVKKIFLILAALQAVPFLFDVIENILLELWIPVPGETAFTFNFAIFQAMVAMKFAIALGAYLTGSCVLIYRSLR